VPLHVPVAEFPTIFTFYNTGPVVQNGATPKSKPIGTGPFKYVSFTAGSQSVFEANRDYWESGKPYVDKVVVDSSYTDNNALQNALESGQINLFPLVPFTTARAQLSAKQVQIMVSPIDTYAYAFVMRVDKGPMADNRVRQAFKLLVDRQAMVDAALSGFGTPGNDLIGAGTQYFASDLKRTQDVEQARSLFKAAGVLGHTFTNQVAEVGPGMVESATILAQQATAAGVKVQVQNTSAATYFTAAGGFLVNPFRYDIFPPNSSLTQVYYSLLRPGIPYGETHWGSQPGGAAAIDLIFKAISATDPGQAQSLWHEAQLQQFNQGGYLVWTQTPYVDAAASNVRGLQSGAGFSFYDVRLQDGWLD
jgi:peptide/nickel transport system substrate-binding protein